MSKWKSSTRTQHASFQESLRLASFGVFLGLNVGVLIYCFVFMHYVNLYAFPKSMDELYMNQPALMNLTIGEAKNVTLLIFPVCALGRGFLPFLLPLTRDKWELVTRANLFVFLLLAVLFYVNYILVPMYR